MDIQFELHLPGLTISSSKVAIKLPRRSGNRSGPFLLISRCSGLALDTAYHKSSATRPIGYRPHGQHQQLWWIVPAGAPGQVRLRSVDNGLYLDSRPVPEKENEVTMRQESNDSAQAWMLSTTPDGIGMTVRSEKSGRYLAHSAEAQEYWGIWLDEDAGSSYTQWTFAQPTNAR